MRSQFLGATSYDSCFVQIKSQCGCLGSGAGEATNGAQLNMWNVCAGPVWCVRKDENWKNDEEIRLGCDGYVCERTRGDDLITRLPLLRSRYG
jgi:hypothetical protein